MNNEFEIATETDNLIKECVSTHKILVEVNKFLQIHMNNLNMQNEHMMFMVVLFIKKKNYKESLTGDITMDCTPPSIENLDLIFNDPRFADGESEVNALKIINLIRMAQIHSEMKYQLHIYRNDYISKLQQHIVQPIQDLIANFPQVSKLKNKLDQIKNSLFAYRTKKNISLNQENKLLQASSHSTQASSQPSAPSFTTANAGSSVTPSAGSVANVCATYAEQGKSLMTKIEHQNLTTTFMQFAGHIKSIMLSLKENMNNVLLSTKDILKFDYEYNKTCMEFIVKKMDALQKVETSSIIISPIFGVSVGELIKSKVETRQLFSLFTDMCYFIETHCLGLKGIFKSSPSGINIKKLKLMLDCGFIVHREYTDSPHIIASLLKRFLIDLPEPLFTIAIPEYDILCPIMNPNCVVGGVADKKSENDDKVEERFLEALKRIVDERAKISEHNMLHLGYLCRLLNKIDKSNSKNYMNKNLLSTIFVSCIFGKNPAPPTKHNCKQPPQKKLLTNNLFQLVLLTLINNYEKFFGDLDKLSFEIGDEKMFNGYTWFGFLVSENLIVEEENAASKGVDVIMKDINKHTGSSSIDNSNITSSKNFNTRMSSVDKSVGGKLHTSVTTNDDDGVISLSSNDKALASGKRRPTVTHVKTGGGLASALPRSYALTLRRPKQFTSKTLKKGGVPSTSETYIAINPTSQTAASSNITLNTVGRSNDSNTALLNSLIDSPNLAFKRPIHVVNEQAFDKYIAKHKK